VWAPVDVTPERAIIGAAVATGNRQPDSGIRDVA
jgi:hypothetical protein